MYSLILEKEGYVVIPFANTEQLLRLQKRFDATLDEFIVFKSIQTCKKIGFVLGGFSALGNAESFHNLFVRQLREWCMSHLMTHIFTNYKDYNVEQIIDRMMYRPIGFTPSRESWHRDESPNAKQDDKMFGGWLNLNSQNQYFSALPKTHQDVHGHKGFATIRDKKEKKQYNNKKKIVTIPPGHILVFYENIIHEVLSRKTKYVQKRVYLAWRLTKSMEPYFPDIQILLDQQSVMPLKSLQIPPMYAKLHWTNWRDKIKHFSHNIIEQCKETKKVKYGKHKGDSHYITKRFLPPLTTYTSNYTPYSTQERTMYKPNHELYLLKPFNTCKRQLYYIKTN